MLNISNKDPKQMAEFLKAKDGRQAPVRAAVEAKNAILKADMSACLYWNQVIKIIDGHQQN